MFGAASTVTAGYTSTVTYEGSTTASEVALQSVEQSTGASGRLDLTPHAWEYRPTRTSLRERVKQGTVRLSTSVARNRNASPQIAMVADRSGWFTAADTVLGLTAAASESSGGVREAGAGKIACWN